MEECARVATLTWGDGQSLTFSDIATEDARLDADSRHYLTTFDGWWGGVGVESEKPTRTLGHGLFPGPVTRAGRAITLGSEMWFRTERHRNAGARKVSGIMAHGETAQLTYNEDGHELRTTVQLDGEVKTPVYDGLQWMRIEVPLLAVDPFLYGETRTTTINPPGHGVGLRWTDGLFSAGHLRWGGEPAPTRMDNRGNAEAWPQFVVAGNFPDGFRITLNGRAVEYPGEVTDRSPVTVDYGAGQVTADGRDMTHQLVRRQWTPIPPGGAITPKLTARSKFSEGWATAVWADTYI